MAPIDMSWLDGADDDAYLELHPDGDQLRWLAIDVHVESRYLSVETVLEPRGPVPPSVHYGFQQRFYLPAMTVHRLRGVLEGLAPFLERIAAGAEIAWDRTSAHLRTTLNDDAQSAHRELLAATEVVAGDAYAAGDDDIPDDVVITAETTDAELAAHERLLSGALDPDVENRAVGIGTILEERRERLRDTVRAELADAAEFDRQARQRRDRLIRRVAAFGDSQREIEALTGIPRSTLQSFLGRTVSAESKTNPTYTQQMTDLLTAAGQARLLDELRDPGRGEGMPAGGRSDR